MKRIFFILMFFQILNAKTLVVDDDYWFLSSPCEHGSLKGGYWGEYYDYSSIKSALDDAVNGDTIKICPGNYKENNLIINKNIIIKSTQTTKIDDVLVYDSSNKPIFDIRGWRDGVVFDKFKIKQNKQNKIAIKIQYGTNYNFKNLIVESKGYGIYQNGGAFQNTKFENVSISSKKVSLLFDKPQNITIEDVNFTSSNGISLDFGTPQGKITIQKNQKTNYFEAKNIAINIGNSHQIYFIKDSKIISQKDDGINVENANSITLENLEIEAGSGGIWIKNVDNDIYIKNVHILDSKYENIYIEKTTKLYLLDSILENGDYGLYIVDSNNGGEIKNNIFKNADTMGLKIFNNQKWRGYQTINNCFENGNNKNILSQDKSGYFNQNYYDDWSGSGAYRIENIPKYDNNPLSSCPIETNTTQEYQTCYITHFSSQSEIDQNWSIIKSENYTPGVVDGKLRLTTNSGDIATGLTLKDKVFKANGTKFKIRFKHYAYDGSSTNGADGIAVVFSDANIEPIAGAFGGSLGYAQRTTPTTENGFAGGWIGIGLDEYGNYSNDNEGRVGGIGFTPQAVAIRGSYLEDYKYLTGTKSLNPPISNGDSSIPNPGYIYEVDVDTTNENKTIISVYRDNGSENEILISRYEYNTTNTPEYFKLSFTGSTGGENNIHEIDDLEILALNCQDTLVDENINYNFDVKESLRNDKNITTKIVNNSFDLELFADKNFTGTVCSSVVDSSENNISAWFKNYFNDVTNSKYTNEGNPTYKVNRAIKNSRIKIEWIKNEDVECPLSSEYNSTLSSDNFAIRPKKFNIDFPSLHIYAGGEFDISFKALDENNNPSKDYNETDSFEINATEIKSACQSGVFDVNASFSDGISNSVAKYSEIGDVNITIKDKNFADVDIDDTPYDDRMIQSDSIIIRSYPYTALTTTNFSNKSILYMDKNLSQYAELNVTIDILNKQNQFVKNFDKNCYSDDINISFDVLKNNIPESFIGLYDIDNIEINDTDFSKFDNKFEIDRNLFIKGEHNLSIKFNIYKDRSKPVSIVDLNFSKTYLEYNKASIQTAENIDKQLSFYYLALLTNDITTTDINSSTKISIIVYDKNRNHFDEETLIDWFIDKTYNENDVKILGYTKDFKYDKNITNFNVNLDKIVYDYNLSVSNNFKIPFVVIHYKTPTYLWFSPYRDYNDSLDSYCISHYCSEYIYKDSFLSKDVGSGDFQGSEVNITKPKIKKFGIKIYR